MADYCVHGNELLACKTWREFIKQLGNYKRFEESHASCSELVKDTCSRTLSAEVVHSQRLLRVTS
jgi:hypothetical protein